VKLEGVIYCGDNLEWMRQFPDEFVDFIYIDPPFFSNKYYEVIFNDGAEVRSFEDRWKGGIEHYIGWMRERVFEMHRILKRTGSFYLHCDWHAEHHLRLMTDDLFGASNFKNAIVWQRFTFHADAKRFGNVNDTILFYTKSNKYTFHRQYRPYKERYIKSHFKYVDADGRKYRLDNLNPPAGRGPVYEFHGVTRPWRFTKEKMLEIERQGRIYVSPGGIPQIKRYLDETKGQAVHTIWDDIPPINPRAKERLGYPTQKPEALLERIIKASSKEGDLVFDPFCGCGTTLVVAHRLRRRWLGIDVAPTACKLMKWRLAKAGARPVEIIGIAYEREELKKLTPIEFQNWAIGIMSGTASDRKTADMGIDGYSFMERDPIQVKQQESIGRPEIDKFETAIRRARKQKGYVVAFGFTKGAYDEVARVKRKNDLEIELLTVRELVEKYGK